MEFQASVIAGECLGRAGRLLAVGLTAQLWAAWRSDHRTMHHPA